MNRRPLLAFALACGLSLPATIATAQPAWPAKPIRIVVGFAPGGTTDILARIMAPELSARLGQPVLVENRAGSGGNVGAAEVAKAAADGYTFLMGTPGTQAINQFLYDKMPFDTAKDFAPVSFVAKVPNVLAIHPGVPARSVPELLALLRSKPGALNYATPGNGSTGHLSTELMKSMAKVFITHIPYRGSGPALADLIAGPVQMTIDNLPSALPHIRSGRLVALAVTAPQSVAALPDVPPMGQFLKGYEAESWFVLMAPAATPKAIVDRVSAEADQILKKPEIVERLRGLGAQGVGGTPQALGAYITAETIKWKDVVKVSGAKLD
ncbi:MAG: Bug family tripartite tricarboxylate transporter substrate binding protein [Aquabacterium sp.]